MKKVLPSTVHAILARHHGAIARCVKCGVCRSVCPSFSDQREESLSPRGRIALIKAVLEGRLKASDLYEDRIDTCVNCMACEETCASGVPVSEIVQAAREQAFEEDGPRLLKALLARILKNRPVPGLARGLAPAALHYRMGSVTGGGPVSRNRVRRSNAKDARSRGKEPGKAIIFFPGCAITDFQPDIQASALAVLSAAGYAVVVPEGLKCCGRPLLSLGDRESAREAALRNNRVFSNCEPAAVVTACASCALTFKTEYPRLLGPGTGIKPVFDIHEFLAAAGTPAMAREPETRTVTWHDPCHLSRGQGLAGTARGLLRSVPGIKIREMEDAGRCCGFGGLMRIMHPGISNRIADVKIRSILATNASAVITGCPGCRMQIREGLVRAGADVPVLHTVQLIEQALV